MVSLTATIWYHPGIKICKWYAAGKKKSPKASFRPKETDCLPSSWALLILGLTGLESGGRDWLQVRAEAASPQQGSGLAQTPAETSTAGVTAGAHDRGGKAGASRATAMTNLAVLRFNKIWNRYFGHSLLIGLETERLSIKFLNKKSHNGINIAIERNAGLCKDPGFLSNKFQKKKLTLTWLLMLSEQKDWTGFFVSCNHTKSLPEGNGTLPPLSSHFESKILTSLNPYR